MTTRAQLEALVERVRAATGPDRRIDDEIARWLGWTQHDDIGQQVYVDRVSIWWAEPHAEWSTTSFPPAYTASLDAVVALIERELPSMLWSASKPVGGSCRAVLLNLSIRGPTGANGDGVTAPLALLAAFLSAKLSSLPEEA